MRQNALRNAGDRLGLFAYLFVVGGGRPYWQALFTSPKADEPPEDNGVMVGPRNPFAGTVPYELTPQREEEPNEVLTP